jgi:hypothetical protein
MQILGECCDVSCTPPNMQIESPRLIFTSLAEAPFESPTMQHSRAFILLALLVCLCQQVASLAIDVRANTQECFFEELDVGDKMTVTFQVRLPYDWGPVRHKAFRCRDGIINTWHMQS